MSLVQPPENESFIEALKRSVLTSQVITGALTAGLAMFLAVVVVLKGPPVLAPPEGDGILSWLSVLFAVTMVAARLIVPSVIVRSQVRSLARGETPGASSEIMIPAHLGTAGYLLVAFQTKLIIAAALLEGAGFFGGIAQMMEGSCIGFSVAAAMIVGILLGFPTQVRTARWIEEKMQQVEMERKQAQ